MPAPTAPLPGPGSRVQFNTSGTFNAGVEEWTQKATLVEADYTNSESTADANNVTYVNRMAVAKDVTFSIRLVYDGNNPPDASPPKLITGQVLTNTYVYPSKGGGKFVFPSLLVTSDGVAMRIKDKIMVDVEMKPNGTWTYPGGFN